MVCSSAYQEVDRFTRGRHERAVPHDVMQSHIVNHRLGTREAGLNSQRLVAMSIAAAMGVGAISGVPASAATVECSTINSFNSSSPVSGTGGTFRAQPGDVVSVTVSNPTGVTSAGLVVGGGIGTVATATSFPATLSYTYSAASQVGLLASVLGTTPTASFTWSCTRASVIPGWVQAYGRSGPDDDCPSAYNPPWAGGPSADVIPYGPSWQQWMNEGRGGWVCTRTVPSLG